MSATGTDRFAVVKPGRTYHGKQGITGATVGAAKICMNVMPMPPGALTMLRNKHVEMPGRKHDNLPV